MGTSLHGPGQHSYLTKQQAPATVLHRPAKPGLSRNTLRTALLASQWPALLANIMLSHNEVSSAMFILSPLSDEGEVLPS